MNSSAAKLNKEVAKLKDIVDKLERFGYISELRYEELLKEQ